MGRVHVPAYVHGPDTVHGLFSLCSVALMVGFFKTTNLPTASSFHQAVVCDTVCSTNNSKRAALKGMLGVLG